MPGTKGWRVVFGVTEPRRASGLRESGTHRDHTVGSLTCQTAGTPVRDDERVSRSDRAVFRLPAVSLLIPFLLFVFVTPLATAGPKWLLGLYILPVLGLTYILLTRTVADSIRISTSGLRGGSRIRWEELDGFEFRGPRWATAVATDGRRLRLPMIRPRDLPRLASVSGGRLLLGPDAPAQASESEPPAAPLSAEAESGSAEHTSGSG